MCKRLACLVVVCLFVTNSKAQGWLEESKAFGAWDLMPAFEAALNSQRLEFKLEYDRYNADIHYQLKPQNGQPLKGKLVFPMLCVQSVNTKPGENKTVTPCVYDFQVKLNDVSVEPDRVDVREISDIGYLLYDHETIKKISELAAVSYSTNGVKNTLGGNRILLRLYVFEVQESMVELNVQVRYSAPYYHYVSGDNDSPFNYYSNDTFFYGFSSASRWAGDKLEKISVRVDATAIYGSIDLSEGLKLKSENSIYTFEDEKVRLDKLKPLIISLDRRAEKQYKQFLANKLSVVQEIKIVDVDNEQADLSVLLDGDKATAWCRDGRVAHLKITLAKPAENTLCVFNGLGVLSGYAETAETMKSYGRAKSADYSVTGVERFSQDSKVLKYIHKSILQDHQMKKRWSPYRMARYFTRSVNNENFLEQIIEIALTQGDAGDIELNGDIEIELEVQDIYKGVAENVCISEVVPLYHCF